tara:strand:+ start:1497 stop:1937 length:441 start_codon:yes stop_codon:yes gene_type:complete
MKKKVNYNKAELCKDCKMPEKPVEKRRGTLLRAFQSSRNMTHALFNDKTVNGRKGLKEELTKYSKDKSIEPRFAKRIADCLKDFKAADKSYEKTWRMFSKLHSEVTTIHQDMDSADLGRPERGSMSQRIPSFMNRDRRGKPRWRKY